MKILNEISKCLTLVLIALIPPLAHAAVSAWAIMSAESSLSFTATQNDAPVTGQFKTYTGDISFDLVDLKNSKAEIVVDISSINTSYADLKATLVTPDWFNANVFPKASFKSTAFTKTGDKTYEATGNLTIRDKTMPVTLTFTAVESSKDIMTVEGSTILKRSAFGIGQGEWSSTKEIKDDVSVHFKLVAKKK